MSAAAMATRPRASRDMTEAQYQEALRRHGFKDERLGIADLAWGYTVATAFSGGWGNTSRRDRLAYMLASRKRHEASEAERERTFIKTKLVDVAATMGFDPTPTIAFWRAQFAAQRAKRQAEADAYSRGEA